MHSQNSFKLNDLFHTLQGEGQFAGTRALFIRLPFCNLKCTWCDTKFNSFFEYTEEEFEKFIAKEKCRFAVITGGEPMMNKELPRLISFLKKHGFYIACETNGNFPIPSEIDFATCSPKKFSDAFRLPKQSMNDPDGFHEPYYVHPDAWLFVREFKYVVDDQFDFKILERHDVNNLGVRLSLSPEFGDFENSVEKIIEYIKEHPQWKLNLQTHKFLGIP